MRKTRNQIFAFLLCAACLLAFCPSAAFAAGLVDVNRDVDLAIHYTHESVPVANVPFDVYRVADIDENAQFSLAGDFQKYPVSLDCETSDEWKSLAETLAAYVECDGISPLDSGATDEQGSVVFPKRQPRLATGLYLVVGHAANVGGYTYTTEPFLVSLPNLNQASDAWEYSVTATPKFARELTPPSPSDSTVERKVVKVWKGNGAQSRPTEAVVTLLRNGVPYDVVSLNEGNNWRHAWDALPEYDEHGSKITWSVVEKELANYTVRVAQDGVTFTVTNTYTPHGPGDGTDGGAPGDTPTLPQTGVLWWPVLLLAAGGLLLLALGTLNRNRGR